MLDHKTNLNKSEEMELICTMFPAHNMIEPEISNKAIIIDFPCVRKLRNIFLNNLRSEKGATVGRVGRLCFSMKEDIKAMFVAGSKEADHSYSTYFFKNLR